MVRDTGMLTDIGSNIQELGVKLFYAVCLLLEVVSY